MLKLAQLTDDYLQKQNLVLPDGTSFNLTLYYSPNQYGWFITELTYGTFALRGVRLVNSPNILHQWKNKLPFGLGVFSTGNREPSQIQDLLSGATVLYVLTAAEVAQYAGALTNA